MSAGHKRRTRLIVATAGATLAALLAALIGASQAHSFIYWADSDDAVAGEDLPGTIGRASLDGSGVDKRFIPDARQPGDPTVDDEFIYWTNRKGQPNVGFGGSIGRARLDGSRVNRSFISTDGSATALAVDETFIYWGSLNNSGNHSIARARLDGTGVEETYITIPVNRPADVAVDNTHIRWTDSDVRRIGRTLLDGSFVGYVGLGLNIPSGIAVNATHWFWATANIYGGLSGPGTTIGRSNIGSTVVETNFITGADAPSGVALDNSFVYWSNGGVGGSGVGTIGRANLDGTGVNQNFIDPDTEGFPSGVAVDALITIGPGLIASGRGRQLPGRLKITVSCEEDCTIKITGAATVPTGGGKKGRAIAAGKKETFKLKKKSLALAAGATETVRVKFKKNPRSVKKIKKLLKQSKKARKRAKVKATVKATGVDGFTSTDKQKIKLKR